MNYNSITIDEEAKYGKVALQDGSFNFKHLQKALDFENTSYRGLFNFVRYIENMYSGYYYRYSGRGVILDACG